MTKNYNLFNMHCDAYYYLAKFEIIIQLLYINCFEYVFATCTWKTRVLFNPSLKPEVNL